MEAKQKKTVLNVFGAIFGLIGIVKLSIIGYYPREAPLFIGILVIAAVFFTISNKIKVIKDGVVTTSLDLPDKWKCDCGAYNGKDKDACENCGAQKEVTKAL